MLVIETILHTIFFNLLAKASANNLYNTPTMLISLKSFKPFAAPNLGIKTRT